MLTKYTENDGLTTLLPEDDAATVNWGADWHMPTNADWQELLDNTTITFKIQNGVIGRLITASNGNSIFLPAAGNRAGSSLYNACNCGYFWSSSLYTHNQYAWGFYFGSDGYYMNDHGRYFGQTVRAVRSAPQN